VACSGEQQKRPRARARERREKGKEGRKKRKDEKERKKKIGKRKGKEKGKKTEKKEKKKEERFRKLGEILGKLGERGKRDIVGFPGFSDTGVISGTTVMARRIDRRDHGKSGIPGEVADSGTGAARGGRRWPERWWAVPTGFAARALRERGGRGDRGFKVIIELNGKVLKTRMI
jgi:hypothetical protein